MTDLTRFQRFRVRLASLFFRAVMRVLLPEAKRVTIDIGHIGPHDVYSRGWTDDLVKELRKGKVDG